MTTSSGAVGLWQLTEIMCMRSQTDNIVIVAYTIMCTELLPLWTLLLQSVTVDSLSDRL